MPPRGGGAKTITAPGVLYTSNGTENPPAVLGSISVLPSAVSYADGFFVFPTQVLARAVPSQGQGVTTAFAEGQALGAYTSFVDLSSVTPDVKREIRDLRWLSQRSREQRRSQGLRLCVRRRRISQRAADPAPARSVEEWRFVNHNNDEHPIHVHVNDFQVTEYFDPTTGLQTGPDKWGIDNANVPAPTMGPTRA